MSTKKHYKTQPEKQTKPLNRLINKRDGYE